MTKKQELLRLNALIRDLSGDTYLGKWLREQRDYLEACIRSDIYPTYTMKEAREEAEKVIAEASKRASDILTMAEHTADTLAAKAKKDREATLNRAISHVRTALKQLEVI